MNSDIGIIDQQLDRVGVIPRYNLKTYNPSLEAEKIKSDRNTEVYGLINMTPDRVGIYSYENLRNYNPPMAVECKKIVMAEDYYIMDYNHKTAPYFYQNQKIPSINENV